MNIFGHMGARPRAPRPRLIELVACVVMALSAIVLSVFALLALVAVVLALGWWSAPLSGALAIAGMFWAMRVLEV